MSGSTSPSQTAAVNIAETANAAKSTFSIENLVKSPGSTLAGAAAILSVLSNSLQTGFPTSASGWIGFGVTVATGIAALFAKAGL